MLILVDQDGVLADFEHRLYQTWQQATPTHEHPGVAPHERRHFYAKDDYPEHLRDAVQRIYTAPGFFRNLPPIDGALDALQAMLARGHDVRICTSPLTLYQNCVGEKYEWVDRHLGAEWVARMVVAKDKTLVHGHILIDDKPHVTGARTPTWQHVVYDQPYNQQAPGLRLHWGNWQEILGTHPGWD